MVQHCPLPQTEDQQLDLTLFPGTPAEQYVYLLQVTSPCWCTGASVSRSVTSRVDSSQELFTSVGRCLYEAKTQLLHRNCQRTDDSDTAVSGQVSESLVKLIYRYDVPQVA